MDGDLSFQSFQRDKDRQKDTQMDYKILVATRSGISHLWCSAFCQHSKCHPQKSRPRTLAGGKRGQVSIELLTWLFLLIPQPLVSFFFFLIGIICMMTPSGTLCVWSLLKLSFGTCPSSPCSYASASSRFSWWSFIFSTASWVFSAAFVTSDRECPFTRESFPQNRPWISSAEWIINKLSF